MTLAASKQLRCAIYARVSDEEQVRGDSLLHQVQFAEEYARYRSVQEKTEWKTSDAWVYVDAGISGTSMTKRTAVRRMLKDAKSRQFDIVLFKGISRFARDTVDALVMLRLLLAAEIRVISLEENYDSERDHAEFMFTIHSALAQAESEKTAVRVRLGVLAKARGGRWNGVPPEGYLLDSQTQRLEINRSEAAVIQKIFCLYIEGLGYRRIADWLNSYGYRTRRGALFSQRRVARILQNPAYCGDVVYGRSTRKMTMRDEVNPLLRRRSSIPVVDDSQYAVCLDAHPALVTRVEFNKVQERIRGRGHSPGPVGCGQGLLRQGVLICRCGSPMTVKHNGRGRSYYCCRARLEHGSSVCREAYLSVDEVDRLVVNKVLEELTRADDIHTEAAEASWHECLASACQRLRQEALRIRSNSETGSAKSISAREDCRITGIETLLVELEELVSLPCQRAGHRLLTQLFQRSSAVCVRPQWCASILAFLLNSVNVEPGNVDGGRKIRLLLRFMDEHR